MATTTSRSPCGPPARAGKTVKTPDPQVLTIAPTGEIEALSMWPGQGVVLARQSQPAAEIAAVLASGL